MALKDSIAQALADMRAEGKTVNDVAQELRRRDEMERLSSARQQLDALAPTWTDAQWGQVRALFQSPPAWTPGRDDEALTVLADAVRTDDRAGAERGLVLVALSVRARMHHMAEEFTGAKEIS